MTTPTSVTHSLPHITPVAAQAQNNPRPKTFELFPAGAPMSKPLYAGAPNPPPSTAVPKVHNRGPPSNSAASQPRPPDDYHYGTVSLFAEMSSNPNKPCAQFQHNACTLGDACPFVHVKCPGVCFKFLKGKCNLGTVCKFSHDYSQFLPSEPQTNPARATPAANIMFNHRNTPASIAPAPTTVHGANAPPYNHGPPSNAGQPLQFSNEHRERVPSSAEARNPTGPRSSHPAAKTTPCRAFAKGTCKKTADQCNHSHDTGREQQDLRASRPLCADFLADRCTRKNCQYQHAKIHDEGAITYDSASKKHKATVVLPYATLCMTVFKSSALGVKDVYFEQDPLAKDILHITAKYAQNLRNALDNYERQISKVVVVLLAKRGAEEKEKAVNSPQTHHSVSTGGAGVGPMIKTIEVRDPALIFTRMIGNGGCIKDKLIEALKLRIFGNLYSSRLELAMVSSKENDGSSEGNGNDIYGFALFSEWPHPETQQRALEFLLDTIEYISDFEENVRIDTLDIHAMLQKGIERLIVIGDVHGCHAELEKLLLECEHNPQKDHVVFLGDLVHKGPNTREVVEKVYDLAERSAFGATCVLGNHEIRLLNAYDANVKQLPWATLTYVWTQMTNEQRERYTNLAKDLSPRHVEFLRRCPHIISVRASCEQPKEERGAGAPQKVIFVHAAIPPVPGSGSAAESLSKQLIEDVTTTRASSVDQEGAEATFWTQLYDKEAYDAHGYVFYGHCNDASHYHQEPTDESGAEGYPAHEKYAMCLDSQCAAGGSLTAAIIDVASLLPVPSSSSAATVASTTSSRSTTSPFAPRNLHIVSVTAERVYYIADRFVCYDHLRDGKCKKKAGTCKMWHPRSDAFDARDKDGEDDHDEDARPKLEDVECWYYTTRGWCPLERSSAFMAIPQFSVCPMKHPAPPHNRPKQQLCSRYRFKCQKGGYQCDAIHLGQLCESYVTGMGCTNLLCNCIHKDDLPPEIFESLRDICPLDEKKCCRIKASGRQCPACMTE